MSTRRRTSTIKGLLTVAERAESESARLDDARRKLLADWCRLVDTRLKGKMPAPPAPMNVPDPLAGVHLTPRMRTILERLLAGDSEKQIAHKLGLSTHTVHTYVKRLHKTLNVCSRGELLAKFVAAR